MNHLHISIEYLHMLKLTVINKFIKVIVIIILKDTSDCYPYLLVNIGSGVSILKVDGEETFERVSGSSLGGGTFWGLCRLLTGVKSFDEMLELSCKGKNNTVNN